MRKIILFVVSDRGEIFLDRVGPFLMYLSVALLAFAGLVVLLGLSYHQYLLEQEMRSIVQGMK